MKFIIDGKAASTALLKLQRVAGKDITSLTLHATKRQVLIIHAYGLQRRSMILVPASISEPGKANIEKDRFATICKGRGKLEFTISDKSLEFRQQGSGYAGKNIAIIPFKEIELLKFDSEHAIPEHIQAKLLPAIRACLITSVFGGQQLGLTLLLGDNYLQVITTDSYHSAIAKFVVTSKEQKRLQDLGLNQPIVLPMEYADILSRQFTGSGLTITVNNRRIIFANKEMKLELPALQSNTAMLQHALKLDQYFGKREFTIREAERLRGILDNMKVIGKADNPLIFAVRKGEKLADINYSAPTGSITDQISLHNPSKRNKRLHLEPHNFYDIAGKLPKGNAMLSYNSRIIRLACQLSEDLWVRYYSSQLQKA